MTGHRALGEVEREGEGDEDLLQRWGSLFFSVEVG